MNFLFNKAENFLNARGPAPKISPPVRNRIDADPTLVNYPEPGAGLMFFSKPTKFLPRRTRVATNPFTDIAKAQSEAYYEEILTIPAASLDLASEFGAGHWYVVHPVTYYQVRDLNNRVLKDLEEWVEVKCPNELFMHKAKQVLAFKNARNESLEEVKKELARRERRGEVGVEEGYTGDWDIIHGEWETAKNEDDGLEKVGMTREQDKDEPVSRHTNEALEEAAAAGKRAAEEAQLLDEWELEL